MSTLNLLNPSKDNLQSNLYLGSFLVGISLLDVFLNSFLKLNITSFLPSIISLLLPFLLGMFGLHLMRIEFSGIKNLDRLNKNINTVGLSYEFQIFDNIPIEKYDMPVNKLVTENKIIY